jgi:hydrogenase-4 membrane subunit HyfE
MTLTLMLCLLATLVPVFFSRVSAAPAWLSVQALALGWITLTQHHPISLHAALAGVEVLLVRALLVPYLLRRAIARHGHTPVSLMPSNLFAWGIAVTLVIFAFKFGDGARADVRALTLGVVATTVVMAFFILASNPHKMAQLVALLFMENALALFESLMPEPWPLPVHLAISMVYVLTVAVGAWLVSDPDAPDGEPDAPMGDLAHASEEHV